MNLIKTSILSLIATIIKVFSGVVINKAISIYIGPSGLALIGQFQNFLNLSQTVAKGGINSGIVKYTAEYRSDTNLINSLWSTSLRITILFSLFVSVTLIFFSKQFSIYVFNEVSYYYVFVIFGFTVIFFSVNQLLLSILNGLKEIKSFISINIIQSVYSLFFTTFLIVSFELDGALIAMVTNQSVIFLILLYKLRNHRNIFISRFTERFDKEQSIRLLKYTAMAFVSACTVPISLILIRNHIGESISLDHAGYWQAVTYISSMYLMVITTALSTYYLPRLAEINNKKELLDELKKGYLIIIPVVVFLAVCIFLLRDTILWILFSPDFSPMLDLFKWQLIGDVIKVISWLLAYLMLAKTMTKKYIITEVVFSVCLVSLSFVFLDNYGLVGVTYAYALNYALYFVTMLLLMKKEFI